MTNKSLNRKKSTPSHANGIRKIALGTSILAGAYLIATAPSLVKSKRQEKSCYLFAHRGLFGNGVPENSLAAFKPAAECGFGIELDVRQSADGTLYVFHDDNVQRMCGVDRKFIELHDSEIDSLQLCGTEHCIPYFDEVLEVIGGRVPLLVELKADMGDKALCPAVAKRLDCYRGEYFVESFNSFLMGWYKHNRPKVVRGQLYTDCFQKSFKLGLFADSMLINSVSRPDFIAYNINYSEKPLLRLCLNVFKPQRFVWTVKDKKAFEKYYNDGMTDGIIFEGFIPDTKETT